MGLFGKIKNGLVHAGHAVGDTLNNKYVKGALATGLALTGVGAVPAAAIMAGTGVASGTLRSGGGLKGALTGAGQGAVTGAAAGLGGKAIRTGIGALRSVHGAPEDPGVDGAGDVGMDEGLDAGGRFRSLGGALKTGLGLASTANGIYSGYQGAKLRGQMAKQAEAEAAANAELRAGALGKMRAAETRPDLSSMLAVQPQRYRAVTVGGRG